jgi:hypothetical protein
MKSTQTDSHPLNNESGFALITAIMMLFAATILGLMVMNSSEIEIMLSGAQQRYENNMNVAEGASSVEAAAVGTSTIVHPGETYERSYVVSDPGAHDQVLSPKNTDDDDFDPWSRMTITTPYTVDENTPSDQWPVDNLLDEDNERFDYHYRVIYEYATAPPKGYDATKFSGYLFQISAQRTTRIDLGGSKVGPKASL